MIEFLIWATPVGLMLDILGFLLVFLYGHTIFMRVGTGPPPETMPRSSYYWQVSGPYDESADRWTRRKAQIGALAVGIGFGLQIIGAVAAICLTF